MASSISGHSNQTINILTPESNCYCDKFSLLGKTASCIQKIATPTSLDSCFLRFGKVALLEIGMLVGGSFALSLDIIINVIYAAAMVFSALCLAPFARCLNNSPWNAVNKRIPLIFKETFTNLVQALKMMGTAPMKICCPNNPENSEPAEEAAGDPLLNQLPSESRSDNHSASTSHFSGEEVLPCRSNHGQEHSVDSSSPGPSNNAPAGLEFSEPRESRRIPSAPPSLRESRSETGNQTEEPCARLSPENRELLGTYLANIQRQQNKSSLQEDISEEHPSSETGENSPGESEVSCATAASQSTVHEPTATEESASSSEPLSEEQRLQQNLETAEQNLAAVRQQQQRKISGQEKVLAFAEKLVKNKPDNGQENPALSNHLRSKTKALEKVQQDAQEAIDAAEESVRRARAELEAYERNSTRMTSSGNATSPASENRSPSIPTRSIVKAHAERLLEVWQNHLEQQLEQQEALLSFNDTHHQQGEDLSLENQCQLRRLEANIRKAQQTVQNLERALEILNS